MTPARFAEPAQLNLVGFLLFTAYQIHRLCVVIWDTVDQ